MYSPSNKDIAPPKKHLIKISILSSRIPIPNIKLHRINIIPKTGKTTPNIVFIILFLTISVLISDYKCNNTLYQ